MILVTPYSIAPVSYAKTRTQTTPTHISTPEYLHLTKRFGIIAASQLPLHYALALKSWSPIQYLTRLSHEELNPYHRLLGRIILTFFSLHASLYLNFYIQKGLLAKRIRDSDVILGLLAISTALLLGTTALSKIRTWNYRVFFYTHVILSISLLPTLYLHVSHLRIYILEASIIYALLIIQRNISQSPAAATITLLPDTNLISITIPLNNNKFLSSRAYKPGQHIYLGFPSLPQKLRINPFSIANPSPLKDRKIRLVARTLAGTTAILADLADHGKTPQQTVPLLIEGPYGSAAHFPNLALNFDRVLLVAGGVGATFALPLFIDLMRHRAEGITTARQGVPSVKFVWTVRGAEDARWGIELVREQMGEVYSLAKAAMEVYVTGSTNKVQTPRAEDADGSIELQERDPLMHGFDENPNTTPTPQNPPPTTLPPKPSRPDFHTLIDQTFSTAAGEKVAVLVCGPKSMGRDLRREVRRWVSEGRDVFWHGEEFAW